MKYLIVASCKSIRLMNRILIIALLFYSFVINAQDDLIPGHLINFQHDTIWGKGYMSKNQQFCVFLHDNMIEAIEYTPDEIKEVRFINDQYFVSKKVISIITKSLAFRKESTVKKSKLYFLKYLIDSEIDLFVLRFKGGDRYFIEKPGIGLSEIVSGEQIVEKDGKQYKYNDLRYRGMLKTYMADSPTVCDKIDKLNTINEKALIQLMEAYHEEVCKQCNFYNYTGKKSKKDSKKGKK